MKLSTLLIEVRFFLEVQNFIFREKQRSLKSFQSFHFSILTEGYFKTNFYTFVLISKQFNFQNTSLRSHLRARNLYNSKQFQNWKLFFSRKTFYSCYENWQLNCLYFCISCSILFSKFCDIFNKVFLHFGVYLLKIVI